MTKVIFTDVFAKILSSEALYQPSLYNLVCTFEFASCGSSLWGKFACTHVVAKLFLPHFCSNLPTIMRPQSSLAKNGYIVVKLTWHAEMGFLLFGFFCHNLNNFRPLFNNKCTTLIGFRVHSANCTMNTLKTVMLRFVLHCI